MSTGEVENARFAIGDQVVHPHHGVGFVVRLEEKQFKPDAARRYYVVSIPNMTLWVPVDISLSGLRKLSQKDELEQCRQVLLDKPQALTVGKDMLANLSARIKRGTLMAQCEVVRDLAAFGLQKPLYDSLANFQFAALNVLCQEWAAVQGITQGDASAEISGLLKKGRATKES